MLRDRTHQTGKYLKFDSDTNLESGRWDSNPRHSAWEADILPLNYTRNLELFQLLVNDIIS